MSKFCRWCDEKNSEVNGQDLTLLSAEEETQNTGIDIVADVVPCHYVSENRYVHILATLGKNGAAKFLQDKMPLNKKGRSGDLGEILAISYIVEETIWDKTVKKLRWADHREMAMRGDDLLAVGIGADNKLQFLKGESKSRAKISAGPINDARIALNKDDGRPTPHALAFLSDRLYEEDRADIADRINAAQYKDGIDLRHLSHMVFTFSGNDPKSYLEADLNSYAGGIDQFSVGVMVPAHQNFIRSVFEKVIADGDA